MQGVDEACLAAVMDGDLAGAALSSKHRSLLEFAELVTKHAYKTTARDVQILRDNDWSDSQVAEAIYVIALFAFFNRVADAFGLAEPVFPDATDP